MTKSKIVSITCICGKCANKTTANYNEDKMCCGECDGETFAYYEFKCFVCGHKEEIDLYEEEGE